MFKTYARICIDESDEDEAAAARLIRETIGGGTVPAVPTAVVTSTGASRSRTQQGVQQRRGGRPPAAGPAPSSTAASANFIEGANAAGAAVPATLSASVGNLIDFGDDPEPRPKASASGRLRSRSQTPPQPAVELVTLAQHGDPFLDLMGAPSASAEQQRRHHQQQQPGRQADGHQPQHPLDLLFGGEAGDGGRESAHAAASTSGAAGRQGVFPSLGSFSDLLRGFGGPSGPAATAGSTSAAGPGPGPVRGDGSNAWGSFNTAPPVGAPGAASGGDGMTHGSLMWPAGAGSQLVGPSAASAPALQRHNMHSQSSNGIDDLLMQHRAMREADAVGGGRGGGGRGGGGSVMMPAAVPGGHYKPPAVMRTDRSAPDVFDPFGNHPAAASAGTASAAAAAAAARGSGGGGGTITSAAAAAADQGAAARSSSADGGAPPAAAGPRDASFVAGGGGGEGFNMNQRELLLYAVPLFKDKLVFLPVVNWKEEEDTSTVLGKVSAGVSNVQQNLSNMWHSLKDKGEFSAKIYKAGQAILENINAEERLMKNIPRKATKLVVHHPASIPPDEVQDELTRLTASFCYKSVGKAAVAGVMLPVAVGLEVLAVPGIGWYTAYQLFKSTSAAAGGSRLNSYLKSDKSEVRVCYAPCLKMDLYTLKSRLSPDGVLGSEDIEDLCHDIREPALLNPLTELRNRYLRKTQTTKADYALLPMSTPDVDEQYSSGPKKDD